MTIKNILESNEWADEVKAQAKQRGFQAAEKLPPELVLRINFSDFPKDVFDMAAKEIGTAYMSEGFDAYETRLRQRQQELKDNSTTTLPTHG